MRIEIDTGPLNDPSAQAHIDALVDRMEVHDVTVTDFDTLRGSRWGQRNPRRVDDLERYVAGPPNQGPSAGPARHRTVVRVVDTASAEAARKLACNPLVVLLEDEEADGWLLEQVIETMGGDFRGLWRRCRQATPAAIDVRSAGINTMPDRIRALSARATAQGRPARLVVIHDSDRRWPQDSKPQKSLDAVANACAAAPGAAAPVCLAKRAIENYIPDAVFLSFKAATPDPRRHAVIDTLLALTPLQRDHFPMKGGGVTSPEQTHAHYAGANLTPLLGAHVLFPRRPRPMVYLQKMGHAAAITARGLRGRDGQGEWDQLLQHIADAL